MQPDPTLRQSDPEFVRRTFAGIANRYDLANHVLSGGLDFLWRDRVARLVAAEHPRRVLDVATGSGDIALAIQHAIPTAKVTGMDFCAPMLERARAKGLEDLVEADALCMPFQDSEFDALTVAFGLRNMASWEGALREMRRVLAPGGLLVVMDFSMPTQPALRAAYRLYLHKGLPLLAGWLTGAPKSYEYLGESIEKFPRGDSMLSLLKGCGFCQTASMPLAMGIASIYTARTCKEGGPARKSLLPSTQG